MRTETPDLIEMLRKMILIREFDELALKQPPEQGMGPGTGNWGLFEASNQAVAHALIARAEPVRASMSRFLIADWTIRSVPVAALSPLFIAAIVAALMSSRIIAFPWNWSGRPVLASAAALLQR